MYIGDNPEHDIQGAKNAGLIPIFIQRDPDDKVPTTDYKHKENGNNLIPENASTYEVQTIRRLTELLDIL